MGSIASTGVGSGLDVAGLVKGLVDAEGAPKALRLDSAEARVQAKLSALGTLRSALAGFRDSLAKLSDIEAFRGRQVSLSSLEFVSGSATSSAAPATYSVEVQQLARAQKQQSAVFADAATVVGIGTLTIDVAGNSFNVVIDSTNSSLAGLAAAINSSDAAEHVGATIINGAAGAQLTITARATGVANAVALSTADGDAGLTAFLAGLTETQTPLDAMALIDGVLITGESNTISGAIDGVEITLRAANEPGETTEMSVGYDRVAARTSLDAFVKSYNAVVDAVEQVASYNSETGQGGPLFGDAGVRNLGYQLRRVLTSNVPGLEGSFDLLNEVGVTAQLDGKLSIDAARLDAAFTADFDAIGALFSADQAGIAVKMDALLEPYLQSGGVFDSRNRSLKSSIDDIAEQRERLDARLLALQDRYLRQFNALDGLLAQLQSTSNFLSQQLDKLPGNSLFKNK